MASDGPLDWVSVPWMRHELSMVPIGKVIDGPLEFQLASRSPGPQGPAWTFATLIWVAVTPVGGGRGAVTSMFQVKLVGGNREQRPDPSVAAETQASVPPPLAMMVTVMVQDSVRLPELKPTVPVNTLVLLGGVKVSA